MNRQDVEEIIACLPSERTMFHYYPDMYCSLILSYVLGAGRKIRWLKGTSFGQLLKRPAMKQAMRKVGGGELTPDLLPWPSANDEPQKFVLTLGRWGFDHGREQTTRTGYNLVLQLNLPGCHDRKLQQMLGGFDFNEDYDHPTRPDKSTLSWARIDVDLDKGEALIEEIQTDWIREAIDCADPEFWSADYREGNNMPSAEATQQYMTEVLEPYRQLWAEATLSAAIWFIRHELGIRRIYYHSWAGGIEFKNIYGAPPKHLYEDLPKRFGFSKTRQPPSLVMTERRVRRLANRLKYPYWYLLELDEAA